MEGQCVAGGLAIGNGSGAVTAADVVHNLLQLFLPPFLYGGGGREKILLFIGFPPVCEIQSGNADKADG